MVDFGFFLEHNKTTRKHQILSTFFTCGQRARVKSSVPKISKPPEHPSALRQLHLLLFLDDISWHWVCFMDQSMFQSGPIEVKREEIVS